MNRVYTATVVAIFVTTSLATNLLVVGTRGPVTPGLFARLQSGVRWLARHLKHFTDGRVASMIARRERLVAIGIERAPTTTSPTCHEEERP